MNVGEHRQLEHVPKFLGASGDENNLFLMMEYCGGGDLLERLLAEGRVMREQRVALEIAIPLLTVLKAMHRHRIIHRCARGKGA